MWNFAYSRFAGIFLTTSSDIWLSTPIIYNHSFIIQSFKLQFFYDRPVTMILDRDRDSIFQLLLLKIACENSHFFVYIRFSVKLS